MRPRAPESAAGRNVGRASRLSFGMKPNLLLSAAAAAALLSACDRTPTTDATDATRAASSSSSSSPAAADPAMNQRVARIVEAGFPAPAADAAADGTSNGAAASTGANATGDGAAAQGGEPATPPPNPSILKAQVLLARANFSPGVIDGQEGSNLEHAIAAYAKANGLKSDGKLTQEVWSRLNQNAGPPVAATYVTTPADVSGPWSPDTHDDLAAAKDLDRLGYTSATEALAEKFQMAEEALMQLNPGVDFTKAGQTLVVAQVGQRSLPEVARIEVDKANAAVRAYGADDKVLAVFPATVGSQDKPSPSGAYKVNGVAKDPTYTYDPDKLTWGPKGQGKFTVKPGPNNPVGSVWIDLNAPSYGLHGTPEPRLIGKTASHGCVRMTNWDALLLSDAVKPGVKVQFVKSRG